MKSNSPDHYRHRFFIERLLITVAVVITLAVLWNMVSFLILAFGAIVVAVMLRMIADPLMQRLPSGDAGAVAVAMLLVIGVPPALTIFGVVGAGLMFGFVGLVFATPLLVVLYVLIKKLYVKEALDTSIPIPGASPHGQRTPGGVS